MAKVFKSAAAEETNSTEVLGWCNLGIKQKNGEVIPLSKFGVKFERGNQLHEFLHAMITEGGKDISGVIVVKSYYDCTAAKEEKEFDLDL